MDSLSRRERAVKALEKLGGKFAYNKNNKGIACAWVHSPARPDTDASVQVYDSGFYNDRGGSDREWAKFNIPAAGTLEQLEVAVGKKPEPGDLWKDKFPATGKSLEFIKKRSLSLEYVGGDDNLVYFPLRTMEGDIKGIQTRTLEGKSYRVLAGSERKTCFNPAGLQYDTVFLTEGSTDTFSLLSFIPNVVGFISCTWLDLMSVFPKNKTYISLFDNDEAGYAANLKLTEVLPVQFLDFSGYKDVNEWLSADPLKFLKLLQEGTRLLTPPSGAILQMREELKKSIKVLDISLTQIVELLTFPLQALQISPLSLSQMTGGLEVSAIRICETVQELQPQVPTLVRDLTQLEAEWLAWKLKTSVYILNSATFNSPLPLNHLESKK